MCHAGAIFDLQLEGIQLGILCVRAVTVVPRKGIRERPSPKGEGFKLRLKPVRVGPAADMRHHPSPSGRRAGDEGQVDSNDKTFPHPSLSRRPLPKGEVRKSDPSPKGERFTDPLAGTLYNI